MPTGDPPLTSNSFADVHYYFQSPSPRPLLHRFDKGSYFYVYHNPTRQASRLEIANHPGTPEQDAFNGSREQPFQKDERQAVDRV